MNTLSTVFIIVSAIIFFVSLIEYLTGAERQGLKLFILLIIAFLILSFIASSTPLEADLKKITETVIRSLKTTSP